MFKIRIMKMKQLLFIVFGVIMFTNTTSAQTVYKNLQDLRDSYAQALSKSDTDAILQIYSDDASIHHVNGDMYTGENEIRNLYDDFFSNNKATIEFKNVSEDKLADDLFSTMTGSF